MIILRMWAHSTEEYQHEVTIIGHIRSKREHQDVGHKQMERREKTLTSPVVWFNLQEVQAT